MKHSFGMVLAICAALWGSVAHPQSIIGGGVWGDAKKIAGGGGGGIAIDGTAAAHGTASSQAPVLTTTHSNDLIVVDGIFNGCPVTGITGTGLTFTRHACVPTACTAGQTTERWSAVASSTFSGTITVTATAGPSFLTVKAYGISGSAHTGAPWDSGGPVTNNAFPSDPTSITTATAGDMVICTFRQNGQSSPLAGTGFTQIPSGGDAGSYNLSQYQVQATAGALSCAENASTAGDSTAAIVDGVVP
jgi:hypothetical protein